MRRGKVATLELEDGSRFDVPLNDGELMFRDLGPLVTDAAPLLLKRRPELGEDVWTPLGPGESVSVGDETINTGAKATVDMLVERQGLPGMYRQVRAGELIPNP